MNKNNDLQIRYVENTDKSFWFSIDKHISLNEFDKKVRDKQGYVICVNNEPVGILRYNLFWDNLPFCTLLYVAEKYRKQGHGKMLMNFWENEMRLFGYSLILVSTRADENAQHFYRKLGYNDCGGLIIANQATELFLQKAL